MTNMTAGKPLKLIFPFMIPLLIGNLFQQLYNISDIIIVGQMIGVEALAAVGVSAPLFLLTIFITFGMASGFSIITGQRFGANDINGVRRSLASGITLSIILVLLIIAIFNMVIDPLMHWMNVPANLVSMSKSYIMIIVNGLWAMMAYNFLAAILRALGDSTTPLYALIFSTLVNIALAIYFVGPLKLGIPGCAKALVIAQATSALFEGIYTYLKNPELHIHYSDFCFSWNELWPHLKMGLPMALHFSILGAGILVMQTVTNTFGAQTIAGFTTAVRVEQIGTMPLVSAGLAIAVFTAQNFGAKRFDRIREGVKKISICCLIYSIFTAIVIFTFGENVVRLFLDNPSVEVIKTANMYFHYSIPFYFFLGQIFLYRNALQGLGMSMLPMCGAMAEFLVRSCAAITLAPNLGFLGVCLAEPISWFSSSSLFALSYFYFIKIFESKNKITI